ncbi:MAG: Uma2 family endonuclease [Terriglobia bacterium]
MATKTLLTLGEYNALVEPVGVRYELDRGELIVTPSPVPMHNIICGELHGRLSTWAKENNLGQVLYEVDVKLAHDTVRRPDLMFFSRERIKGIDLDEVPLPIAPDLVIEVVSKNDQPDDLMLKVRQYLQAGVRAVWLLYRKTREAYRYTPEALHPSVVSAERGGKIEEPELLPGFSLLLSEILP